MVLHGTAQADGAEVPGYTTAGKTGTAQVVENGRYEPGAYVASFVGMVPAERPKYVILVKVERPHGSIYGSARRRAGVRRAGPGGDAARRDHARADASLGPTRAAAKRTR